MYALFQARCHERRKLLQAIARARTMWTEKLLFPTQKKAT
jgi:hypothetical protein